MIVTPLIFWFFTPLVVSGIAGFLGGYALAKLVEYVRKVKHLNRESAKQVITPSGLSNTIGKNLKDESTFNRVSKKKQFLAKEDNKVYTGNIDQKGNLTNVAQIEYDTIDDSLNKELDDLDDDNVLLI